MAAPQCIVRVHRAAETLVVQVEGWGTMTQSVPLRRHVEKAVAEGVKHLRMDLGGCQYLDSTFLGTLFVLKRLVQPRGGTLSLDALSSACQQLMQQMGVECLFPVQPPAETPSEWCELDAHCGEAKALQRNVVQAHEELATVEGKCGDTFGPVARCLSRDQSEQADDTA